MSQQPVSLRMPPWHSVKPGGSIVFHDESYCWDGDNIEQRYWRAGDGSRRRCNTCTGLATQRDAVIRAELIRRRLRK